MTVTTSPALYQLINMFEFTVCNFNGVMWHSSSVWTLSCLHLFNTTPRFTRVLGQQRDLSKGEEAFSVG